ncbi:MAG TPA: 16S rRNA (guanine(966)-N(2))-methyltransferase RsmD [Solirubrobacteraceae bacterium]|jgi:16S rRNA (guanine(966)-N(2))-methyltransferase RsmD|nr:16S rRNA (guanine(966)-N(2))-methyltransferase RsmD [Solirubrobacteraceae bacterium]
MSPRVIAGRYGGRRLKAPPGDATRPTADRVREALFSILGARVPGARVLDLFAGSGALGLEALSRGAQAVTFVERAPAALAALRENLAALGADAAVERAEALRWLRGASDGARQYDLVFLDPPYRRAAELGAPLSELLPAVLAPGALVIAECDRRSPLELTITATDERRYGDTLIRIHAA